MMWKKKGTFITLMAMALLALAGCGDEGTTEPVVNPDDGGGGDGKEDQVGDGVLIGTTNNNLALNKGYHALFDTSANTCVEQSGTPQVQLVDVQERFDLSYVTSREELASDINIDLGLKFQKPKIVDIQSSNSLVRKFKGGSNNINLLLQIDRSYLVINKKEVDYQARAFPKLEAGTNAFVQACGGNYVSAVRYGGYFRLLITFSTESEETATEIKNMLGAGSEALSLEVSLNSLLSFNSSMANTSLEVTAVRGGMDGNAASLADLIAAGISSETLNQIKDLETSMTSSVRTDFCADSGQCAMVDGAGITSCAPCDTAPGYFDNDARTASVIGVQIGSYAKLFSSEPRFEPIYDAVRNQWTEVERYVRDLTNLQEAMIASHVGEIQPFMDLPDARKAYYNNPDSPATSLDDLKTSAAQWDALFNESNGSLVLAIHDHLHKCWGDASANVNTTCAQMGNDGTGNTVDLMNHASTLLADYQSDGRILPMKLRVGAMAQNLDEAKDACNHISPPGTFVVPTASDAAEILLALRFGDILWPNERPREIFIESSQCDSQGLDTIYAVDEAGVGEIVCREKEGTFSSVARPAVCVSVVGVFSE